MIFIKKIISSYVFIWKIVLLAQFLDKERESFLITLDGY